MTDKSFLKKINTKNHFVRLIYNDGLFIEDAFVGELTEHTILKPCPSGFYLPKWDGTVSTDEEGNRVEEGEWVEGLTEEEIQEIKDSQPEQEAELDLTEIDGRVNTNTQKISEIAKPLGLNATRQVSRMMVSTMSLSPEEILEVKDIYEEWEAEIEVEEFEHYNYKDNLYQVIKGKGHTTQLDWTPDQTPSLFNKVLPAGEIGEWEQPLGSHDAYQLGDKVYFEGKTYVSIYKGKKDNNNVWKPSEHGWEEVE